MQIQRIKVYVGNLKLDKIQKCCIFSEIALNFSFYLPQFPPGRILLHATPERANRVADADGVLWFFFFPNDCQCTRGLLVKARNGGYHRSR